MRNGNGSVKDPMEESESICVFLFNFFNCLLALPLNVCHLKNFAQETLAHPIEIRHSIKCFPVQSVDFVLYWPRNRLLFLAKSKTLPFLRLYTWHFIQRISVERVALPH